MQEGSQPKSCYQASEVTIWPKVMTIFEFVAPYRLFLSDYIGWIPRCSLMRACKDTIGIKHELKGVCDEH